MSHRDDLTKPSARTHLDWLVDQLDRRVVLVGPRAKTRRDTRNLDLPGCDDWGRYPACALDITVTGRETDLGSQLWGAVALAAVMLAGLSLTWWARIYLGPLWSSVITRKEDHSIVDTGPYALVRHPIYTGLIIALLATAAAEGRATALIGAAFVIFGVWLKARTEERFLMAELGAEIYGSYCRRVSMLILSLPPRH